MANTSTEKIKTEIQDKIIIELGNGDYNPAYVLGLKTSLYVVVNNNYKCARCTGTKLGNSNQCLTCVNYNGYQREE